MASKELTVILKAKDLAKHTLLKTADCNHYITKDGKYIRRLKGENKRNIRKKIRKWVKLVKSERMTETKFYEKYNAWKNHASHGNCVKLCHSMDLYVEKLFKSNIDSR